MPIRQMGQGKNQVFEKNLVFFHEGEDRLWKNPKFVLLEPAIWI